MWPSGARVAESSIFHGVRVAQNRVPGTSPLRERASRRTSSETHANFVLCVVSCEMGVMSCEMKFDVEL